MNYSLTPISIKVSSVDKNDCCGDLWYACFSKHLNCIRNLISKGHKFRTELNNSLVNADYSCYLALYGDLDLLQHCIENGCPIHPDTIIFSTRNINMMKWLIEIGQPVPQDTLTEAYNTRSFESFKYLVKHFKYINSTIFERAMNEYAFKFAFYILLFAFSNETELNDQIKKTNRTYVCMSMNRLLNIHSDDFETSKDHKLMIRMLYKYKKNTKFIVPSNLTYLNDVLNVIDDEKNGVLTILNERTTIAEDVLNIVCEYI